MTPLPHRLFLFWLGLLRLLLLLLLLLMLLRQACARALLRRFINNVGAAFPICLLRQVKIGLG